MIDRETLIEDIASSTTDSASEKELMQLFYDNQVGYLSGLSNEDLLDQAIASLGLEASDIIDIYAKGKNNV